MKKLLFLLSMIFILFSCTEETDTFFPDESKDGFSLQKYPGDGLYDALGNSCDITKDMYYSKQEVIDNNKVLRLSSNAIFTNNLSRIVRSANNAGATASTYLKSVSRDKSINVGTSYGPATGSASITSYFKDSMSLSNRFSYASYEKIIETREYTYSISIDQLRSCVSDMFINNINNYFDPNYIINQYGTHVYSNAVIGGKLKLLYQAEISSSFYKTEESKTKAVKTGLSGVMGVVKVSGDLGITITSKELEQVTKETSQSSCLVKVIGGTSNVSVDGYVFDGKSSIYNFNPTEWEKSVVDGKQTRLVDFRAGTLIPIYELVSDPTKRNILKTAVENYIKNSIVTDYTSKVALYRSYIPSNNGYMYSTNKDLLYSKGGRIEGVAGYVCSYQAKGTIPLHGYYSNDFKDYTYTVEKDDAHYAQHTYTNYLGIVCYVPVADTPNALPFHCYKLRYGKPTKHYYTTTYNGSYRPTGYPYYYGITCHVFKD